MNTSRTRPSFQRVLGVAGGGREGFPETGDWVFSPGDDAFVVGFEEDAHGVDDVVCALEEGGPGLGGEDVGFLPGYGGGPGGWGAGGGDGGPVWGAGTAGGVLVR